MIPILAIVGRPNVGKSSLFNAWTRSLEALVYNEPGITRDRLYGEVEFAGEKCILIDTGGLAEDKKVQQTLDDHIHEQAVQAMEEADGIVFVVDAQVGLHPLDQTVAKKMRALGKPVWILLNKIDGVHVESVLAEFYKLGLDEIFPISAKNRKGLSKSLGKILSHFMPIDLNAPPRKPEPSLEEEEAFDNTIRVSIIGQPNAGKSTLMNRLLGEERVLAQDEPGTTRDVISVTLERKNQQIVLMDTAGIRKKAKIRSVIEKFSVIKALKSIESANVVILMVDAIKGLTEQDLSLLGFIEQTGKSVVIACNKWDKLPSDARADLKKLLKYRLRFIDYAPIHFIAAQEGFGISKLMHSVYACYTSAMRKFKTSELTSALEQALARHQPPLVRGRRIKLRYMHAGGRNPPLFLIYGNQTDRLPDHYKRYLMKSFREAFKLVGTPIKLRFVTSDNPYKGRYNKLTPRQEISKRRLMRFVKKRDKKKS